MADAEELKLLSHPRLLQDAGSCQVVWARVKGYPYWPAQVLSDSAAQRKLGKVSHKKNADVPVMFFGTLEIAWIGQLDVVAFGEGITAGYLAKGKQKTFLKACAQVLEFLCLDKKRKAPQAWWCRPPEASLPLPTEQAKANSKPCTPSKKVVARGKPTCSPTASTSSDNSADSAMESGCEEEECVLASAVQPVIGKPAASLPAKGSLSCSKLPKCKACPAAQ
ncbi:histone-lysine N-methyltransferase, partial [Haematococcus lacustris]